MKFKSILVFLLFPFVLSCTDSDKGSLCNLGEVYLDGLCQIDTDRDGIPNRDDNCIYMSNRDQLDSDNDNTGDVCEGIDSDNDTIPDTSDNCIEVYNPVQQDSDKDGVGDVCENSNNNTNNTNNVNPQDQDNDEIIDTLDNCPEIYNPGQEDRDNNNVGDVCEFQEGNTQYPFIISVTESGAVFDDNRDTSSSNSSVIDSYPPDTIDESGPEYVYIFTLPVKMTFEAWIDTEPDGVDIDLHLLSSISPVNLIERDNSRIYANLESGTYYIVMDTYDGAVNAGEYNLHLILKPFYEGTVVDPVIIGGSDSALVLPYAFTDSRDTSLSNSDEFDTYPPSTVDESGPEYIYKFTVDENVHFLGEIFKPEPGGVDVDIHLLSSINPPVLIERSDHYLTLQLTPGTYYIVVDTFENQAGSYNLDVSLRSVNVPDSQLYFHEYILAACEYLDQNYGLLGYDINSVLTHDIPYGTYGDIPQTGVETKTMCVAAVLEVLLTAMQLYEDDTGDSGVWDFLPWRSYRYLGAWDIKAHIWVNHELDSWGSADAVRHFGMGVNVPFENLVPGTMLGINRTTGSGHAVIFISFIDINGTEYTTYNENVVGFRYFSAQGGSTPGYGGLFYKNAIFDGAGTAPDGWDSNIIRSANQNYLPTGLIYHPDYWLPTIYQKESFKKKKGFDPQVSFFDSEYFTGE
jgi:Thrombospondin type 3 repeat